MGIISRELVLLELLLTLHKCLSIGYPILEIVHLGQIVTFKHDIILVDTFWFVMYCFGFNTKSYLILQVFDLAINQLLLIFEEN